MFHKVIIAKIDLQCTIRVELRQKTRCFTLERGYCCSAATLSLSRIDATNVEIDDAVQQQNTFNGNGFVLWHQFTTGTKCADVHATTMDVDMDSVEAPYEHYLQLP